MIRKRLFRNVLVFLAVLAGLLVLVGGVGLFILRGQMKASLPLLEGAATLPGLEAPVTVERDEIGVPRIVGGSRVDLARATGFVHAQERFFQMDLLRRGAAGELSALLGGAVLDADRGVRLHRFRARAGKDVDALDPATRRLLAAYADGVNAGLTALEQAPPEYQLLRVDPAAWRVEDSLLVVLAMYLQLQDENGIRESSLGLLYEMLPAELADFLSPAGTPWDAPLAGAPLPEPPLPPVEVFDARGLPVDTARSGRADDLPPVVAGSNNWAISGEHTASGVALVANDMHLSINLPNTWYRATFEWRDGERARSVSGVTLAGTPAMIAGSNGRVAWGFTNSQGDWADLIQLEIDPGDESRYRTPDGWTSFVRHQEHIEVKGGEAETLEVLETIWGPVIDTDHAGRRRALRWVAHDVGSVDLDLLQMETVETIDEAIALAHRCGIPAQNLVVGDTQGRIGWTLIGRIPRRFGFDGRLPASWADGSRGWNGWLAPEEYPRLVDPPSGRLWTANNRTVEGDALARLGNGGYAHGSRALQIRDALFEVGDARVEDMLAIQLDDRALFLETWRDRILAAMTDEAVAASDARSEFRERLRGDWSGRASIDSVGYRLVRGVHLALARELFNTFTRPCADASERFRFFWIGQWDGPLWRLVDEQPEHLLPPPHTSWDGAILAAADAVLDELLPQGRGSLAERTWGERNTVAVRHPLSRAVPQLGRWLDIPPRPLAGDSRMPRVQTRGFGASERFAVSPGLEDEGYLHMPGGQSGHFMSPFYRAGHEAWADGTQTSFLPGPAMHTLELTP